MDLDFSEFHPLDHNLWECRGYPGGWRRHLEYRWVYQWSDDLEVRWAHLTRRHVYRAYAQRPFTVEQVINPGAAREWEYHVRCLGCDAEPDAETAQRLIAKMKEHGDPPTFD